jgi:hypothetical protein
MDSASLRRAYTQFLDAAETVAHAGSLLAPPPGQWDADQQLAHVVAVDAGILATACAVAAGGLATFDNRLSLDPVNLARITRECGDSAGLRRRIRAQGQALCAVTDVLGAQELDRPIPTLLMSGASLLVDQPLRLRELISGLADDHLPRHTQQLLSLLPQVA